MTKYVVWCPDLGQEQEDGATIPADDHGRMGTGVPDVRIYLQHDAGHAKWR